MVRATGGTCLPAIAIHPDKISEYFRKFLSVTEREHDSHWTREAVRAVTAWAFENEGALSDDASGYKHRAITYMDTHAVFETDGFIDMVLNEGDPSVAHNYMPAYTMDWLIEGLLDRRSPRNRAH